MPFACPDRHLAIGKCDSARQTAARTMIGGGDLHQPASFRTVQPEQAVSGTRVRNFLIWLAPGSMCTKLLVISPDSWHFGRDRVVIGQIMHN